MSHKIQVFCDHCSKQITKKDVNGVLGLMVTSPSHTSLSISGDFCSIECATVWLHTTYVKKIS